MEQDMLGVWLTISLEALLELRIQEKWELL